MAVLRWTQGPPPVYQAGGGPERVIPMEQLTQEQALTVLLESFPALSREAIADRFTRAWTLYRHGAATPVSGCSPWAWEVRCAEPQKKREEEPLRYTATIAGGVQDWRCECGDNVWRRATCKHILTALLTAMFGPAPEPGTVRIVADVDVEYEAWCMALEAEIGSEPPDDDADWAIADWADEDLAGPQMQDVVGHLNDAARR
jgi:hypothetical protein